MTEILTNLPSDLTELAGGVYQLDETFRRPTIQFDGDYRISREEKNAVDAIWANDGAGKKDNPLFFVRTINDGKIHVVRRRFRDKFAMGKTVDGFTIPEMVAVNLDPLPITIDGWFVLPYRGDHLVTNPGMVSITGAVMTEEDLRWRDALYANLLRSYLLEQGMDLRYSTTAEHIDRRFAVRDIRGKGFSFVAIVQLKLSKQGMEYEFRKFAERNPDRKVSQLVFVDASDLTYVVGEEPLPANIKSGSIFRICYRQQRCI